MREAGLVPGQCKTAEKSNEITAIPELLQLLDVRGATVTIDAMGCQTHIAETIRQGDGHYLLSVKEIQPTLHDDAETLFAEATDERVRSVDEAPRPLVNTAQNPTALRQFALNLLARDTTRKVGIATSRKRAGWDRNYLITLKTGANG